MGWHHNPKYLHHQTNSPSSAIIREIVFGMEDGMVSTMGAVTGIAAATQNHFTVVLSGLVIIAVESISMAVGSYLSNKSEKEIDERKMNEEREELVSHPAEEKEELIEMYVKDGWTRPVAAQMAEEASKNHDLFLKEMAYRELKIIPGEKANPLHNGLAMGVSYILGGAIPLLPYLLLPHIPTAIPVSVTTTLVGLFGLGVAAARYSARKWWKAGLEMCLLASAAGFIGYSVGQIVEKLWLK